MDIKHDLQALISDALHGKASSIFLQRATKAIAESADDKKSLADAAGRVGKMVALFIDEDLSRKVVWDMMSRIHENGSRGL